MAPFVIPPEPSKEEILLLRSTTLEKLQQDGQMDKIDERDVHRFETSDDYIRRFLMHHDNDQKRSSEMAIETLKWRKEVGVNDITEDSLDKTVLERKSLFTHNRDIDGCKLLVFSVRTHNKDIVDPEKIKTLLLYWVERLEREGKGEWITVFFDMTDTGFKNMDMSFIQYMIKIFTSYYPWVLNYIIVFEMPWILNALWKIVKGWLPPKSIDKIKFVDKKSITTYVPKEECLTGWGGTDSYEFVFEPEAKEKPHALMNGDVEGKKVHFAEENGAPPTEEPSSNGDNDWVLEHSKLQVVPSEELTFSSNRIGTTATISITNKSASNCAFKIKTTTPERYRVRPSVGVIGAKSSIDVTVTLSDQLAPAILVRDKFLIIAVPALVENVTQQEFAELLKNTSMLDTIEVRMRVGIVNSEPTENVSKVATTPAPASPVLITKLDQLSNRQIVMEEQLASIRRGLYVIFFLLIALLFVFVFTTNNLTSSILAHTSAKVHPHSHSHSHSEF